MESTTDTAGSSKYRKIVKAIGREKEKKEIIDQLISLQKKTSERSDDVPTSVPVPLMAIVGIAGIGKTTLAHLVCEDGYVRDRFGSAIVVENIYEAFDVESIARRVVVSAETTAARGQKRHLLVLDDLRAQIHDLSLITRLLSKLAEYYGVTLGAILVTTRSTSFLPKATHDWPQLQLQGLDEKQSRLLFRQHLARGPSSSSRTKHQDGENSKIVGKCRGVPLAIITMAESLESSQSGAELNKEYLGKLKSIYYDDLPTDNHRGCFAYVSFFPGGHLVDVDRLLHLWMAEGFLETSLASPEEIGRWYFNYFLEGGIFQDVERDEVGVVRSCRMHPLLLDIACFVAKGKDNIINATDLDNMHKQDKVVRASLNFSLPVWCQIPDFLFEKAEELRSILLQAKSESLPLSVQEVKVSESTCKKIFTAFKRLRVSDLHDLGIKKVLSSIGNLTHLRYLDLSHNNMEKLPGSITKLCFLQTLKLSQCHFLKELPRDLRDLRRLRHLDIEGCLRLTHMPLGMKMLTSLQTLSHFVVSKNNRKGGLEELPDLNNLKGHLEILHLERLQFHAPADYLKQKQHLQRLTLRWDRDADEKGLKEEKSLQLLEPHASLKVMHVMGYKGDKFSSWLTSLQSLVKFSLYNCPNCKFLPPLDQLPSLNILELRRLYSLKFIAEGTYTQASFSITTARGQFFPSLKELTICDCPKLESWWEMDNNVTGPIFCCISTLQVQRCPKLTCMPLYPGLDEKLVLVDSSVKPMRDTIHYDDEAEESNLVPFSTLKSMLIASIEQSPPEAWLRKFNSLEKLHVRECFHLQTLPKGFKHLNSLQSLTIENCPMLDLDSSIHEWEGLQSLHTLIIMEIPQLKFLCGLEKVTSLEELKFFDCHGLTSLPDSIGNLTSLGKLVICKCSRLSSLPKGLKELKSLHTLIIIDCPLLLPRCQQETGDDWPQIAHIKNISVKQTKEYLGLENSMLLL